MVSVVGIDFGNLNLLIGQTSKGGVDVILNDASNRQTATAVSIQGKQRFIGDSGAAMAKSNIKNTISCMKMLVGRQFDDPSVQTELSRQLFKAEKLPHGGVGISIMLNDEPTVISAEHFMAMLLTKAKEISAGANAGLNLADAVLAVPFSFTQSQRMGVLHACQIASINCLKVANENTLIALSYGIFKSAKKLFHETEPTYVMFIDLGYTGYSVCVVEFIQENMKVLATVNDRELGGRDFDNIIIEFLAEQFEKKTKINVRGLPKAWLKLQAGAEKAKKTLSPIGVVECPISVECLSDDHDLGVVLSKDELEKRSEALVGRLQAPIEQVKNNFQCWLS
jgi:heat shock protein 4